MSGLPVTIRLLDPPLHEFLPKTDAEIDEVAKAMGVPADKLRAAVASSCTSSTRCSASAAAASASAIPRSPRCRRARSSRRAVDAGEKTGKPVIAEIMIPLIVGRQEFDLVEADHRRGGGGRRQGDRGHGSPTRSAR